MGNAQDLWREEKKRPLAEADALPRGVKGAWLRKKGLYAAQLSNWRRELAEFGEAELASRRPGRKGADPRDKEIERLKKLNARLEHRAYVADQLVDLQKILHLFDGEKSAPGP
jgi:transposase